MLNNNGYTADNTGYGRQVIQWLMVLCCTALVAACAPAPVQEMSEARQAIDAARAAGAEEHAPEHFNKAESLLEDAQGLLNDRRFRDARRSAAQARDEAIEAREAAQEVSAE